MNTGSLSSLKAKHELLKGMCKGSQSSLEIKPGNTKLLVQQYYTTPHTIHHHSPALQSADSAVLEQLKYNTMGKKGQIKLALISETSPLIGMHICCFVLLLLLLASFSCLMPCLDPIRGG